MSYDSESIRVSGKTFQYPSYCVNMTMEIFVYLHSNDVSVEGGERNNYPFPFIISIKPNGSDDRNLTDMRENKSYGRNSFAW